jgi:cysteine desulfurase/selenocysteine lyase
VHDGRPLVYLDSAASSQKPRQVLDAMTDYYERHHANVHRGVHTLAEEATALYEGARDKVAAFINAPTARGDLHQELLRGAEPGGQRARLGRASPTASAAATEIVITQMEHHSNIVPWQLTAQRTGAELAWLGLTDDGRLDLSTSTRSSTSAPRSSRSCTSRTSSARSTRSTRSSAPGPRRRRARRRRRLAVRPAPAARRAGARRRLRRVHRPQDARPDRHRRAVGPAELLNELPPFLGGGEMIETVTMEGSTYAPIPHKYEAGTRRSPRRSGSARPSTT